MNGAVYISFFQGQLESVLEQVVQLAVQEISKTVGSSLNALLLETAAKEQENQRLAVKLQQSREGERKAGTGGGTDGHHAADRDRSPPATVHHSARAGDSSSARTKPEQHAHTPGHGHGHGTDTRRLEQKGRVVGQLKTVMEQVLDFAVCELTKIVEASFDDLLLEITQKDREQHALEERLDRSTAAAGGGGGENGRAGGGGGRRRGSENDSASPSGSDDAREDMEKESKEAASHERDKPAVISVSQDWVPILDKVFGQKWCSDIWQIKDEPRGGGGRVGSGGGMEDSGSTPICDLEPSPTSPQQDPRWTPLEDMEVLSPEDDDVEHVLSVRHKPPPPVPQPVALGRGGGQAGHAPLGPALSPTADLSGHCSSASMLHRLLTLPAQLLDNDQDNADATETLAALATEIANCRQRESAAAAAEPPDRLRAATYPLSPMTIKEEEEEEGDEEEDGGEEGEEDKGRKKKRRRVWLECEECGRRFSRASLLKAHRQTHNGGGGGGGGGDVVGMETSAPPSPLTQHHHHHHHVAAPTAVSSTPPSQQPGLRCSECGKRFSSASRLHSHLRSHHPGKRP